MNHNINITFDIISLKQPFITAVIKECISTALSEEKVKVPCEINVLITNDRGIRAINQAYRQIDKPTDVLSFPMFQLTPGTPPEGNKFLDPETGLCPLGDMAISLERAVAQAKEYGHTVKREVGYLTIHSMLHLLGYDHLDEGPEKALMRQREEIIANQIREMKRD